MGKYSEAQAGIERRHAEVLGQPPRLPPVAREAVAAEVRATTDRLRRGVSGASGDLPAMPIEAIPEIMFTLCRYPELWQSIMDVTIQIQGPNSVLSARDRKLLFYAWDGVTGSAVQTSNIAFPARPWVFPRKSFTAMLQAFDMIKAILAEFYR